MSRCCRNTADTDESRNGGHGRDAADRQSGCARRIAVWSRKSGKNDYRGGLDASASRAFLKDYCAELAAAGIRVSLFIDADPRQLEAAVDIGAPIVEIHTGHYAEAHQPAAVRIPLGESPTPLHMVCNSVCR